MSCWPPPLVMFSMLTVTNVALKIQLQNVALILTNLLLHGNHNYTKLMPVYGGRLNNVTIPFLLTYMKQLAMCNSLD